MQFMFARLAGLSLLALPLCAAPCAAQLDAPVRMGPSSPATEVRTTTAWKDSLKALRVCSDPNNLPFSNVRREGLENKIAEVIARDLGDSVTYLWWPNRRGFVRNTLSSIRCDVIMGVPAGLDMVLATAPYYRSTYYIVSRADRHLGITTLDDPSLKQLMIGVSMIGEDYTNTPPAMALSAHGITHNVKGFSTFYDVENHPGDIVDAVVKGGVDVALVWGPIAGYYAKQSSVPLTLVALPDSDSSGLPFSYEIAIGVRHSDHELKDRLDAILEQRRPEIERILREYNVPTVSEETR